MTVATRRMATQTVSVERMTDRDGQGKPRYETFCSIEARVVREDAVVQSPSGTDVRTTFTVYVDAAQPYHPLHKDRLAVDTLEDRRTIIVEVRKELKRLNGAISHVQLWCREE